MKKFNDQYNGKFILDITVLKNISGVDKDIEKFRKFIGIINPNEVFFETPGGKFENALGVPQKRINEITDQIHIVTEKK